MSQARMPCPYHAWNTRLPFPYGGKYGWCADCWPGGHTNLPLAASYLSSTSGMRIVERTVMCAGYVTSTTRSRPAGQAKISSYVRRIDALPLACGETAEVRAASSAPTVYGGTLELRPHCLWL